MCHGFLVQQRVVHFCLCFGWTVMTWPLVYVWFLVLVFPNLALNVLGRSVWIPEPPASASHMLELQTYAMMPALLSV